VQVAWGALAATVAVRQSAVTGREEAVQRSGRRRLVVVAINKLVARSSCTADDYPYDGVGGSV